MPNSVNKVSFKSFLKLLKCETDFEIRNFQFLNNGMYKSMMSYSDRHNARNQRMNDIENRGMDYVMDRDKILKMQGLDPLGAEEYERNRIRFKTEARRLENIKQDLNKFQSATDVLSPNGREVEDILKTKSVGQVIEKFIESYSEDDYPPMFQEFACQDEQNIEMQKLSADFEKECQLLAVDFLRRHADKVSPKALVGFAGANICESTFNRMFK